MEVLFGLNNPQSPWKLMFLLYSPVKMWPLEFPLPSGISNNPPWGGDGYFSGIAHCIFVYLYLYFVAFYVNRLKAMLASIADRS